ncbi:MAG: hypothetical protein H7Z73_03825 [Candidatus Saccharibacteria bacterium]|nr:hypothetical protein [Moraxellaceae bacterium]
MNNNIFLVLVLVLLSGCSTVGSNHPVKSTNSILHPIDCISGAKREECLAVANFDKKNQKKTVKSAQTDQMDRRARLAKIAESKKINDEKAKVKREAAPLAQDNAEVSKPDLVAQKKIDNDDREKAFSASMGCVRNNLGKIDDVRKPVRAVAFELAVLCRQKGVSVHSVANATIPLVSQSRAPKK